MNPQMNKPTTSNFIIMLLLAAYSVFPARGEDIKASELTPHQVIGVLGKPLGTRIVISGVETVGMAPSLRVTETDGRAITNAVTIVVKGSLKLQKGIHYKLEGYESGAFEGLPGWVAPNAQQFFSFHSFFIVTKILEPANKP
jgi:hypothetical protein